MAYNLYCADVPLRLYRPAHALPLVFLRCILT